MASACNPTDEVESPTDLQPSAETVAKNTPIAKFLVKAGYLYLIALNLTVLFYDNVPISLQVLSTSIVCIVLGSFGSLRHPESAEAQEVERLKPKDAYMFPVFGSMALCSFYLAIKYLPAWIIDLAAQLFFTVLSAFASQSLFEELALEFFPGFLYSLFDVQIVTFIVKWKCIAGKPVIPMISVGPSTTKKTNNKNEDVIDVKLLNIVTLLIGAVVAFLWYLWDGHWFCNNIIGISLSIQAISFLNPGSYYTATVLLSLLFFYDIFWVFGTDVMVTVAKNLKAPIKLIFPRPAVLEKPNMLGLGDIVLPGIYIALLLRYDIVNTYKNVNFKNAASNMMEKIHNTNPLNISTFCISLVCYLVSLGACLLIMWQFDAAQPALLYIVPGIILPIIITTFVRGDFNALWSYDEEPEDEKKKD
eukprot:75649_1